MREQFMWLIPEIIVCNSFPTPEYLSKRAEVQAAAMDSFKVPRMSPLTQLAPSSTSSTRITSAFRNSALRLCPQLLMRAPIKLSNVEAQQPPSTLMALHPSRAAEPLTRTPGPKERLR